MNKSSQNKQPDYAKSYRQLIQSQQTLLLIVPKVFAVHAKRVDLRTACQAAEKNF